jgi:hypothetical protein
MKYSINTQYLINENTVLKLQCNELLQTNHYLLNEINMIKSGNTEQQISHSNTIIFLQQKNTKLSKLLLEKQKQLVLIMQKYDIPNQCSHVKYDLDDFANDE